MEEPYTMWICLPFIFSRFPLTSFVYDICSSKYRKGALYFPVLYLVDMTVSQILQCAGIVDMFQLLPVTHVLMICNVIYTFVLIHYEARVEENESAREFTYPFIYCAGIWRCGAYFILCKTF